MAAKKKNKYALKGGENRTRIFTARCTLEEFLQYADLKNVLDNFAKDKREFIER